MKAANTSRPTTSPEVNPPLLNKLGVTGIAVEYGARGEGEGQEVADLVETLKAATPERHPILSDLGPDRLVGGDRGDRHDWALDAIIAGVAGTPLPGE